MIASEAFLRDLWDRLETGEVREKEQLQRLKAELVRRHHLRGLPSNAEILAHARGGIRGGLEDILRVKPTRSASGVAVVSVMTPPHPCPHGVCIYCPGGPRFGTPQSYTGTEPAARRAARHRFDPEEQAAARVAQLRAMGHPTDKIDLIILGGTFSSLDPEYKESFVKGCFDGLNGSAALNLEAAHRINEAAARRCIGLTIETKPDCLTDHEAEELLRLGATRVELGIQTTHDDVLRLVNRGHTDADSRLATKRVKDAGLKLGYHMMPGLPGNTIDRDLASFRAIFEDPAYRPDMLKIYPTLVLEGTALHTMWSRGRYTPLSLEEAIELLAKVKAVVPPWVRIQRIQREIGADVIEGGPTKGDLRLRAQHRLGTWGLQCKCIRCREIGLRRVPLCPDEVRLHRMDYEASGGHEVFLSYEDGAGQTLVGYARLRTSDTRAFLRELKVFGDVVPISADPGPRWQHRRYGARLVAECERIAREEEGRRELFVTSGVGVREYYRRLGYARSGPYMAKALA